jgi:serine protease Do
MRKAVVGGLVAAAVAVGATLVLAPTMSAQGPGGFGADRLLLVGPGSAIGVGVRDLRSDETASAKIETGGVAIATVREDSPASRAGLQAGDIVIEFDGERVRSARHFSRLVTETPPGRTVPATIVRGGNRQTLQVTPEADGRVSIDLPELRNLPEIRERIERGLRQLPRDFDFDLPQGGVRIIRGERIGMTLSPLSDQLAAYFGVREGVLVSSVQDGSVAARAGLRAGDVITAVGGEPVDAIADVVLSLRNAAPGSAVEIRVTRDRQEVNLKVEIGN